MHKLFILALLAMAGPALAQENLIERYVAGRDYQLIDARAPAGDEVSVTEYFWYGCPACYRLEPELNAWLQRLPAGVAFNRLPALGSDWHEIHARAYYIAGNLGRLEDLHGAVFHVMHEEGNMLRDMEALKDFFVRHGVSPGRFDQANASFQLDSQLRNAAAEARKYGLRRTPNLVINGKYLVRASPQMLQVADFLIEKESARL